MNKKKIKENKKQILEIISKLRERKANMFDYYLKVLPEFMENGIHLWEVAYYIGLTKKPGSVMEIGSRNGGSLICLLSAYAEDSEYVEVTSFDLWREGSKKRVLQNLNHMNLHPHIDFIKGKSNFTVPEFKILHDYSIKFDYILVDGCHEKEVAKEDLYNCHTMLNKGGILVMDDLTDSYKLIDVWNDWKRYTELKTSEILEGNGIGIAVMP